MNESKTQAAPGRKRNMAEDGPPPSPLNVHVHASQNLILNAKGPDIDEAAYQLIKEGESLGLWTASMTTFAIVSRLGYKIVCGNHDPAAGPTRQPPLVYDLASLTKVYLTLCANILFGKDYKNDRRGKFGPKLPIRTYVPIGGPYMEKLTVDHLLNFQARFSRSAPLSSLICDPKLLRTLSSILHFEGLSEVPGQSFMYGNGHSILGGRVLQGLVGDNGSPSMLVDRLLGKPLMLAGTTFYPFEKWTSAVYREKYFVPTGNGAKGFVHDPISRALLEIGVENFSAGIFATAYDVLKIISLILDKGLFYIKKNEACARIIEEKFALRFGEPSTPAGSNVMFGHGFGLWDEFIKNNTKAEGGVAENSPGGIIKTAHTGHLLFVHPNQHCGGVILCDFLERQKCMGPDEIRQKRKELFRFQTRLAWIMSEMAKADYLDRMDVP